MTEQQLQTELIQKLVPKNDPILRTKTERFNFKNPPVDPAEIAHMLAQTVISENGLGLACPQIGLPYRAFIIKANPLLCCFNPIIVDKSAEEIYLEEGCLTFPGLSLKIKRPEVIRVRYTLPNGQTETKKFQGMTARVFQHELDHLDGILFIDRATRFHLEQGRNQMKKRKRT